MQQLHDVNHCMDYEDSKRTSNISGEKLNDSKSNTATNTERLDSENLENNYDTNI